MPVIPTSRNALSGGTYPSRGDTVESPRIADVTKIETLGDALTGASAVIFAASASKKGGTAEQGNS